MSKTDQDKQSWPSPDTSKTAGRGGGIKGGEQDQGFQQWYLKDTNP